MPTAVDLFKLYFEKLDLKNLAALDQIYAEGVVFKDPIHEIRGIKNLKVYFEKLNKNLVQGSFTFTEVVITENKAVLSWEMNLTLKRPNKQIKANGISVLSFDKKITSHRDYFDAGELFYEHIPLLGGLIRFVKRKISSN